MSAALPTAGRVAHLRARAAAFVARQDPVDWAMAMTLLLVAQHAEEVWYVRHPATAIAAAGLVLRGLPRRALFWAALLLVLAIGHLRLWYSVDNHEWLLTYWCLALGCSRLAARPARALATSARLLVGLCFLLATAWKVGLREFRSGDFFEHAALFDLRFASIPIIAGGMPAEAWRANQFERRRLYAAAGAPAAVPVRSVPSLRPVAVAMTVGTILIEGLIALCFLWPADRGPSRVRDPVLLAFLVGVYPIASVVGFGWLLAAMGAAQARGRWALAYVAAFALLPLYHLPYGPLLRALLS